MIELWRLFTPVEALNAEEAKKFLDEHKEGT